MGATSAVRASVEIGAWCSAGNLALGSPSIAAAGRGGMDADQSKLLGAGRAAHEIDALAIGRRKARFPQFFQDNAHFASFLSGHSDPKMV